MWNTKIIQFIENELHGSDAMFKETPYYRGDVTLRKANLMFQLTDRERTVLNEIRNPLVYSEYCNIIPSNANTRCDLALHNYQKEILVNAQSTKYMTILHSRQMGITLMAALIAMHYANNYEGKTFVYLAINNESAAEFVSRVKMLYAGLPFFMKPGILAWNAKSVEFDNGCRIVAKAAGPDAVTGMDINFLYVDQAAFIRDSNNPIKDIIPVMVDKSDTRIIISSIPNGFNWFYKLFNDAESAINAFRPYKYAWNLVPNRDAAWKISETNNLGSAEMFEQEYNLKFLSHSDISINKSNCINKSADIKSPTIESLMDEIRKLKLRVKKMEAKDGR